MYGIYFISQMGKTIYGGIFFGGNCSKTCKRTLSITSFVIRPHVLRLALQEALQGDLSLETHLGFHTDIHQNTAILVPLADAVQIASAALIVYDKGRNLMPQTFLEHDESANTSVSILEGKDLLKANMEIQYDGPVHSLPGFIFPDQFSQAGIDFLCGHQPSVPGLHPICSIFPRCDAFFSLINGADHQHIVKVLYEFLSQRLLYMV